MFVWSQWFGSVVLRYFVPLIYKTRDNFKTVSIFLVLAWDASNQATLPD